MAVARERAVGRVRGAQEDGRAGGASVTDGQTSCLRALEEIQWVELWPPKDRPIWKL